MTTPLYLAKPTEPDRTYGTLTYDDETREYVVRAEPMVLEAFKRIMPGCDTGRYDRKIVRFAPTPRMVGDLNWLLLRYPLKIKTPRFDEDRAAAIEHAERRALAYRPRRTTPPPTFVGALKPYQQAAMDFLLVNPRTLYAADMGLGKTVVALAALSAAQSWPVLIVVPPNIRRQWVHQAGHFLRLSPKTAPGVSQQARLIAPPVEEETDETRGNRYCHVIAGRTPYPLPRAPIYIIHYGLLADWSKALQTLAPRLIIFDEMQELRHPTTKKYSAASLLSSGATYVWGLSGTPTYNYGKEIWSVANILDFNCLGSEEAFTREWCTGYGGPIVENPELLGQYLREEGLMLRQRKTDADVAAHLPPKRRVVQLVDSDSSTFNSMIQDVVKIASTYDTIKDWQAKGQAARAIEGGVRKATGVAKAPSAAAFVLGLLEAGEHVIVCAHHHDVHAIIADALSAYNPVRITGEETDAEKRHAVEQFKAGNSKVVLLALRGAAGLDGLQHKATCIVFAELDWSPAIHAQAEDRIQRVGVQGLESILCYYLVSDDAERIDEAIQQALGLKIAQHVGIMGDQAETEDDRLMAQRTAEKHVQKVISALKRRTPVPGGQAIAAEATPS